MESLSVIIIITLIVILFAILIKSNGNTKKMQEENEKYKEVLYRYKDYKCKSISDLSMTEKDKLNYLYDDLTDKDKHKLLGYAETLHKNSEVNNYDR